MKPVFIMTLRLLIAFAMGLLISLISNPLVNWPFGLPVLLALLLGMIGIQKVNEHGKRSLRGWLSASCLAWFGLELPILLHPQEIILTFSGCFVGCDGGPNAIYPDQSSPATFAVVFIGFLLGLFAISSIVTIAAVIRDMRAGIL